MPRTIVAVVTLAAVTLAAVWVWRAQPSAAQSPRDPIVAPGGTAKAPAPTFPIAQVILFSSGVGYFQREGEIEGTSRVDLSFAGSDVNDLLKSLVLQDSGGKISTINYDSPDPIEKTLKSFALDLTTNPSFGQLLNQARGEKVEVTLSQSNATLPGTLTGVILGMESQRQPHGKDTLADVELLNLVCSEGVRSVPLTQVSRVRFLNPVLDTELHRALEVLASRHDANKKVVSLTFTGEGKRPVKVGYVIESPIWKTSYRLVLDDQGKVGLQGWAVVENTSDDDWKDVRMALVSGRPISFQMNLYEPLFIPRPTVEPELFASLRPPTFNGALNLGGLGALGGQVNNFGLPGGLGGLGAGGGVIGVQGGQANLGGMGNGNSALAPLNRYNLGNGQLGIQGGGNFGGGQFGLQGGNFNGPNRLTFEQLQERRQEQQPDKEKAKKIGSALAAIDLKQGVTPVTTAEEVGDYFRYIIDHKVTLPRQKSALLPIVNHAVEATRVSIFNESIHDRFPLLGLKFKNTSGQDLMQGPITVYEGSTYAGDAHVADLQPGEERLLAYAIDQGTEVKAEQRDTPEQLVAVKVVKGAIRASYKLRETKTYFVKNRSTQDRVLILEHPLRGDWKLVEPQKPMEKARDVYRFQVTVPAGKSATQQVVEEKVRQDTIDLDGLEDKAVRVFLQGPVAGTKVKESLEKAIALRGALTDTQRDLTQVEGQLKAITDDQARLRANLDRLPQTSAAHKRYLEKFDTQETEIEKMQDQIKKLQTRAKSQQKEYEDYLMSLSVE
jgi:hypothetical protein